MVNLTKEQLLEKIQTSDLWLNRAVLAIYQYQTNYEKSHKLTKDNNFVGFNGPDGKIMTSFGERIQKDYNTIEEKYHTSKSFNAQILTDKQKYVARKKIVKYANQILRIVNDEQ